MSKIILKKNDEVENYDLLILNGNPMDNNEEDDIDYFDDNE